MKVILLELPVFLLLIGKGKQGFLLSLCLYFIFCAVMIFLQKGRQIPITKIRYPLLSMLISLLCGVKFFLTWGTSGRFAAVSEWMNMPGKQCCIIAVLLLAPLSVFGADAILKLIAVWMGKQEKNAERTFSETQTRVYIFLTSLLTVTLNSKSSPLYPFNDWVDPNTMFTVGKGVLKGYVPYRDLYEQKGPLLLFFHTFGAAVSFDSFIGIWILEVLAAYLFLLLSFKTARLYFENSPILLIPFTAAAVYGSYAFLDGDSGEEFALPFLMYGLYILCKALKKDEMPSRKEFFLIGLTSACVFWIKYSLVGFYLGWIIILSVYSLRRKNFPLLLTGGCLISLGLIAVTVPITVYFAVNSSLSYFWEAYFYNNLFYYPGSDSNILSRISVGLSNLAAYGPVMLISFLIGLLWALNRHNWQVVSVLSVTFLCHLHFVFFGSRSFQYYAEAFGIYVIFGCCWMMDFALSLPRFREMILRNRTNLPAAGFFMGLLLLSIFSENMYFLKYHKEDLFQYRLKEIIEASGKENPTVMNYNLLDLGVNTTAGLVPNLRFFCTFNLRSYKPMEDELSSCLETGCADYLIVYSKSDKNYREFDAYEHVGGIPGPRRKEYGCYHYYVPKQ